MDVLTIVHFWRVRGVSLRRVTLGRVEIVQIWGDSRVFKTGLHWCERDVIAQFCFLGFCFVLFLFFCLFFGGEGGGGGGNSCVFKTGYIGTSGDCPVFRIRVCLRLVTLGRVGMLLSSFVGSAVRCAISSL